MKSKTVRIHYRDVEDFVDLIGRRWRGAILACLCVEGPMRFSKLKEELKPITSKQLITNLRYLENNLMVTCEKNTESPNSVLYFMTEHGRTIAAVIYTILEWSATHRQLIIKKTGI